jgi:hypothetical protein
MLLESIMDRVFNGAFSGLARTAQSETLSPNQTKHKLARLLPFERCDEEGEPNAV